MAAGRLLFPGLMPSVDTEGDRVSGAKAYFYADGTTTLADTFTDATLTVKNTNPVSADSVGVWPPMWADTATAFTVAITDASGVPLPGGVWSGLSAAISATTASVGLADASAAAAAASAASALAAPGTSATSNTNLVIGLGGKAFNLNQAGKLFSKGQRVVAASAANSLNQMSGVITAFADPLLTVTMDYIGTGAAGAHADWIIALTGDGAVKSIAGLTGDVSAAGIKAAMDISASAPQIWAATTDDYAYTPSGLDAALQPVAVADAATVTLDLSTGRRFTVAKSQNGTLGNPINAKVGMVVHVIPTQDGAGSRTWTFGSAWKRQGGAATLSTAAGAKDYIRGVVEAVSGGVATTIVYTCSKSPS